MKLKYFPHHINSLSDERLQRLLVDKGVAGLGIYWYLVEKLYKLNGKVNITDFDLIAYELRLKEPKEIYDVAMEYGLFEYDDANGYIWSKEVKEGLEAIKERYERAKAWAEKRWSSEDKKKASKPKPVAYSPYPQVDPDYEPPVVDLGYITKDPQMDKKKKVKKYSPYEQVDPDYVEPITKLDPDEVAPSPTRYGFKDIPPALEIK